MRRLALLAVVLLLVVGSASAVQADEDRYGGQIIIGSIADASLLNPIVENDSASYDINYWVFDSLIRLDETLTPQPVLAESWEISDDATEIVFHLKEGVLFHDGVEFTAADVEFTIFSILDYKTITTKRPYFDSLLGAKEYLDRISELDSLYEDEEISSDEHADMAESAFEELKAAGGIEVVDDYTIVFNLATPFAPFLTVALDLGIAPKHLLEGEDINATEFNSNPIGTGPFQFVEWRRADRIVLEAFDDYHEGRPYLDRVIYRVIPDQTVLVTELRSGGVDYMPQPPPEMIPRLEDDPNLNVMQIDTVAYTYMGFQLTNPLFQDVKVRQAISYAIDMEAIVEFILLGYGQEATGPFPEAMWAYNPDVRRFSFNPDRAIELMAEAGWTLNDDGKMEKDGEEFAFTLETNQGNELREQMVVIIQEQLSEIGIDVTVSLSEWPTFVDRLLAANYEAVVVGWTGTADPDGYGYTVWHSSQFPGRNTSQYANDRVDYLFEQARVEMDIDKRTEYYHEIQEILAEEQPYVFGYFADQIHVAHARYQGWVPTPQREGIMLTLKNVWIED